MSASIVSSFSAVALNKAVQEHIHPTLFLCCNYEPTISHAISEDGRYLVAIQDLYKFAIDSSCIIKQYRKILPKNMWGQFGKMQNLLDYISLFRSVFDHNTSEKNGQIEKEHLDSYTNWIRSIIGKNAPETSNDYKLLNQKLSDIAVELLQYLNKFVTCVSKLPDRTSVVRIWTDLTLHWYCNNTKTDIYKGQLMTAYIANAKAAGRDYPNLYRSRDINRKIKKWIKDALIYPVQSQLDAIETEINTYEGILSGQNPVYRAMRERMDSDAASKVDEKFRSTLAIKRQKRTDLEKEKCTLEEQIGDNIFGYFFNGLNAQLRRTIIHLESEGISYTLLPQDLLQEDIEHFFASVPSPEGDF